MKPAPFVYLVPSSAAEAVEMLVTIGDEAKVLAGGQSLMPLMNMRLATPSHVVDINDLDELAGVEVEGGTLRVGALTRQRTAELSSVVRSGWPLLADAVSHIGHVQIRHRGTVGGNLVHSDPASELPAVAVALDAVLVVQGPDGTRRVAAADFFESAFTPALGPDELLVAVEVPAQPADRRTAFDEFARRHGDFALASVALTADVTDGVVVSSRIVLAGVGSTPVRCAAAEERLTGAAVDDEHAVVDASRIVSESVEPGEDTEASADYRRALAGALASRALRRALG